MTQSTRWALAVALLIAACGSKAPDFDDQGLVDGSGGSAEFTRACQLYFRGNLSDSRDLLTGFEARYPQSPLAEDAALALRRIQSDLEGASPGDSVPDRRHAPAVTLVTRPELRSAAERVAAALRPGGYRTSVATDPGAPEITLVLYTDGQGADAREVTTALERILANPESVVAQPAGELAEMIEPGFQGVLVVVGGDATLNGSSPADGGAP